MSDTQSPQPLLVLSDGDLPEFEGRVPVAVNTNLQGGGQRITRALHHDQKVFLVVEAKVAAVNHPMTKDGVKRTHVLKVDDLYELNPSVGGRLLTACKQAWRVADDHRHGRTALEGLGVDAGVGLATDESGVVLTPGDLVDELGLADSSLDPVVVVLASGQKLMWPDEFPSTTARPMVGDFVPDSEGDDAQVEELLDPVTGESLGVWSEADEDARLLALEVAAEAEEATESESTWAAWARRSLSLSEEQWPNRAPWDGYNDDAAKQVVSDLNAMVDSPWLAKHVLVYERAHKGRLGVITCAEARVRALADAHAASRPPDGSDLPALPVDGFDSEVEG